MTPGYQEHIDYIEDQLRQALLVAFIQDVPAAPIVLPAFPALGGREVLYRIDPAIQERIYL